MPKLSKGERMNANQMTGKNTDRQRINEWRKRTGHGARFNLLSKLRLANSYKLEMVRELSSKTGLK